MLVDRHIGDVSDTLQMLKFLARNIDITDVFKSVILATLNLPPDDLHDAFALQALYQAASPYLPETIVSDTDSATTDTSYDSQASSDSETSP